MPETDANSVTILLTILNIVWGLVLAFGAFVVKRIVHELDENRKRNEELFQMCSDMKEDIANRETKLAEKYVSLQVFEKLRDDITRNFERTSDSLEKIRNLLMERKSNE